MQAGISVNSLLAKFTNDLHVPIAIAVVTATSIYHFHTGKDLGSGYVSSLYAFYGFLAGHFGLSQKWPDQNSQGVSQ
jgi:hypothetical protein